MSAIERWNSLLRFVNELPTIGEEGVRDTENPCELFAIGEPIGHCSTDGHYMCNECKERDVNNVE